MTSRGGGGGKEEKGARRFSESCSLVMTSMLHIPEYAQTDFAGCVAVSCMHALVVTNHHRKGARKRSTKHSLVGFLR